MPTVSPLMQPQSFTFHHETHARLRTSVPAAFEHLDDFRKLSAHMERPSAMMLGSRMEIFTDDSEQRNSQPGVRSGYDLSPQWSASSS